MTLKLAILISGRGSNMRSIHQAIQSGKLDAKIQVILSDNAKAPGLEYARSQNIHTEVLEKKPGENRSSYDRRLVEKIESYSVDIIALAGFMRLLSPEFVHHFENRIVNIHPSLLPAFPGLEAQRQALQAGVPESGCTVHFVDDECDHGPVIDQRVVPVLPGDTEETLAARILEQEHQLYPACLQKLAEGKIKIVERKVKIL